MCFAINKSKKFQYLGHKTLVQSWNKKKSARVISTCINSKTTSTKLQLLWFACDNCRVKSFKQLSTRLESCNGFHVVSHSTQTRTAEEMDGVLHKFHVAARTTVIVLQQYVLSNVMQWYTCSSSAHSRRALRGAHRTMCAS